MQVNRTILVLFCLCLLGCNVNSLQPDKFIYWYNNSDNGLTQKRCISPYQFTAYYKSAEYMAVLEKKKLESIGMHVSLDSLIKSYDDFEYYQVNVSLEKSNDDFIKTVPENNGEYEKAVSYFSFEANKDISLVKQLDTFNCVVYHFERNYSVAPYNSFILGFEKGKEGGDRSLLMNLRYINTGPVVFHFSKDDIKEIPQLENN